MDPQTATETLTALITTHMHAESDSLKEHNITPFDKKVYTLLLQIPSGKITTYSILARILNSSPRAVGNACRRNPFAPAVPCHRVVATGGGLGGFKGEHMSKIKLSKTSITSASARINGPNDTQEDTSNSMMADKKTRKALLTLDEKRRLLRKEGVKFDFKGEKVLGTPFAGFTQE